MLKPIRYLIIFLLLIASWLPNTQAESRGWVDQLSPITGPLGTAQIYLVGWACLLGTPQYTQYGTVEVFRDGPAGAGVPIYAFNPQGESRPDTVEICLWPWNGFSALFFDLEDVRQHTYWIYYRDPAGNLTELGGSPARPTY